MNLEEAYNLINKLYEKYLDKEIKRNELVCRLVKKQDKLKNKITKEDFDIYLLESKLRKENLKIEDDEKFMKGFFIRLITCLLLSSVMILFFKDFFVTIMGYIIMLLMMSSYCVTFTIKNGHLPFRKTNEDYLKEMQNNLDNKLAKKEELERQNNKINNEIHVYSHLNVYNKAQKILQDLSLALNEQIGFEQNLSEPQEKEEITWLDEMERKLKRDNNG